MRCYCISLKLLKYSMTLLHIDYTTLPRYTLVKKKYKSQTFTNKKYKEIYFSHKMWLIS